MGIKLFRNEADTYSKGPLTLPQRLGHFLGIYATKFVLNYKPNFMKTLNCMHVVGSLHALVSRVMKFSTFGIKFLNLQSMNVYLLSVSARTVYCETKKSWRTQYFEIFQVFGIF